MVTPVGTSAFTYKLFIRRRNSFSSTEVEIYISDRLRNGISGFSHAPRTGFCNRSHIRNNSGTGLKDHVFNCLYASAAQLSYFFIVLYLVSIWLSFSKGMTNDSSLSLFDLSLFYIDKHVLNDFLRVHIMLFVQTNKL